MVKRLKASIVASSALASLLLLASCRSSSEFNPYASIGSYDTVVIEDFEGPGTSGYEFAERLSRAISRNGLFQDIMRHEAEGRAMRITGVVLRYEEGNAALRIKYGATMGNARFKVQVDLEDFETGDFIGSMVIVEEFEIVGPTAPKRQNVDTLAERAARDVADRVQAAIDEL